MAASTRRVVVEFVQDGRIAVLRMQRGENRFHPEFVRDFHDALDAVEKTSSVKAVITTGEGKYYSNGLDLDYMLRLPQDEMVKFSSDINKLVARLLVFPAVTIAALSGHCYAMGAFLALAHDYRVMRTDRGWFCLPEIFLNLRIPSELIELARNKLPSSEHISCIVLGKRYTGEEALKTGIVHRTSSNTELMDTAVMLAQEATSHGKEDYDSEMLSQLKHDLYASLYKCLNEKPMSKL